MQGKNTGNMPSAMCASSIIIIIKLFISYHVVSPFKTLLTTIHQTIGSARPLLSYNPQVTIFTSVHVLSIDFKTISVFRPKLF